MISGCIVFFAADTEVEDDEPFDAVLFDAARPVRRDAGAAQDLPLRVHGDDVREPAGGLPAQGFGRMQ